MPPLGEVQCLKQGFVLKIPYLALKSLNFSASAAVTIEPRLNTFSESQLVRDSPLPHFGRGYGGTVAVLLQAWLELPSRGLLGRYFTSGLFFSIFDPKSTPQPFLVINNLQSMKSANQNILLSFLSSKLYKKVVLQGLIIVKFTYYHLCMNFQHIMLDRYTLLASV